MSKWQMIMWWGVTKVGGGGGATTEDSLNAVKLLILCVYRIYMWVCVCV